MKYLFILLLFSATHLRAQSRAEKEVAAAVDQLRQLLLTPDSSRLANLVSNNLSYGHSSGLIEDKATFINALVSGKSDFQRIDLTNQSIQVMGDLAIVRHQMDGDIVDNNKPGKVKLHILTVWQKQKGVWHLVARQAAKLPA